MCQSRSLHDLNQTDLKMTDQGLTDEAVAAACKDGNPITKVKTGLATFARNVRGHGSGNIAECM